MTFRPRLDVLPAAQRRLWPAPADVPEPFVLYGGTALALRLAHRASVDFDFFAAEALDADRLLALPFAGGADVRQRQPDTLTLSLRTIRPAVKVSFSGRIDIGRVGHPERADDGVLQVASMLEGRRLSVADRPKRSSARRTTMRASPMQHLYSAIHLFHSRNAPDTPERRPDGVRD